MWGNMQGYFRHHAEKNSTRWGHFTQKYGNSRLWHGALLLIYELQNWEVMTGYGSIIAGM